MLRKLWQQELEEVAGRIAAAIREQREREDEWMYVSNWLRPFNPAQDPHLWNGDAHI